MSPITSATTDEDLTRMERDIRQLKIEYEQYFGGGRPRPPSDVEWRIEQTIKRYGDRSAEMSFGQRFRYSNLTQTYAKYRDVFHKRLQKRETGAVDHHFGAAARAIEMERAQRNAQAAASSNAEGRTRAAGSSPEKGTGDPSKDEALYKIYKEALERTGASTSQLSPKKFQQFLEQKREQLRKVKDGQQVEFVVSVEDGKPRLKARVRS